jgi:hypothetical protein
MVDTPTDNVSSSDTEDQELETSTQEESVDDVDQSEEAETSEETGGEEAQPRKKPSKRSAKGRINQLIAENKEWERKYEIEKSRQRQAPIPDGTPAQKPPEVQRAVEQLKGMGFVHQDEFEKEKQSLQDRMVLNTEHQGLSDRYDGSDGRPKYVPEDVEQHMRDQGIYQPEVAYKAMHESELNDWFLKNAPSPKKGAYKAPPSAPSKKETQAISREKLTEMQAKGGVEWRNWYEKNREKILTLMAQGNL